ncbi:hypothetical protein NQ315_009349 [Exocentrus adspersus]|uniref:Chitin-binding type-2 domain-containing protein n=1 Tax=Exocentrus adspersus TaxID=1586481 RepID=A0AAV8WFI4_9CUCU|nr:hypothetical protein NQ315_009349 [Exocentrus adspersus]
MNKALLVAGLLVAVFASVLAVPDCPDEDEDSHATYYPHETECWKYYECDNGVADLLDCPTGLYWDVRLNVCNWDADCGDLSTSTAAPTPTTEGTTIPTTDEATTTESDG